jgi:hypothetical protein
MHCHRLLKTFYRAGSDRSAIPDGTVSEESAHRDVMMPSRRRTREQDHRDRINPERQQRTQLNAQQAWLAANEKPSPLQLLFGAVVNMQ